MSHAPLWGYAFSRVLFSLAAISKRALAGKRTQRTPASKLVLNIGINPCAQRYVNLVSAPTATNGTNNG